MKNIKEDILINSGIINENKILYDLNKDFNKWQGKMPSGKDFMDLGNMECAKCGEKLGDDFGELRPHTGSIVGFKGKNYHQDCFTVPKNAQPKEKISFLDSDDESSNFVVANITDDWDSSIDWSEDDED